VLINIILKGARKAIRVLMAKDTNNGISTNPMYAVMSMPVMILTSMMKNTFDNKYVLSFTGVMRMAFSTFSSLSSRREKAANAPYIKGFARIKKVNIAG
jgi:hypothetical protein